jgi:hypothetical protein
VKREDVLAFVRRDWDGIARGRRQYWADRYRRDGGGPARLASTVLFEHASRLGSRLLDADQRAADLDQHLRVRQQLDRAARALTGR